MGKLQRRKKALMALAKQDTKAAEKAMKKYKFYVLITCQVPKCPNNGNPVNVIVGMKNGEDVDTFMEGWDPRDDDEDRCIVCTQAGLAEGYGEG